jgi:hypothetical protein
MDGQPAMMNQLLTFVVLDRVLDDGGGFGDSGIRDLVLPLVLCSTAATSAQGTSAGSTGSNGSTTTAGWDAGGPLQMVLLLSLLKRRPSERFQREGSTPPAHRD